MKSILIGMSGGVDSSVAAYILHEQGHDVTGFTMQLCDFIIGSSTDGSIAAASVADQKGIPFMFTDNQTEFRANVVEPFISEYEEGRTPNPCIECNKFIKFTTPLKRCAQMLNKESDELYIATGHYAVVTHENYKGSERWCLKKSANLDKDQSYFLYALSQDTLSRTIFPLGDMDKDEVRKIAEEQGFVNAHKKDSQDICFIPDGNHARFIENYTGHDCEHGNFVDQDGNILGEHQGIIKYTIGQRKGLGLSLKKSMYVSKLDAKRNEVVLAYDDDLLSKELETSDFNWVSIAEPTESFRALGRIRYRHQEAPCTVTPMIGGRVKVVFDQPQRAITAGQSIVLYDIETDTYVLGGGKIK